MDHVRLEEPSNLSVASMKEYWKEQDQISGVITFRDANLVNMAVYLRTIQPKAARGPSVVARSWSLNAPSLPDGHQTEVN